MRVLGLGILVALLVILVFEVARWPRIEALATSPPVSTAFIDLYRREQLAKGEDGQVRWQWVDYEAIAPELAHAVLVLEDIGFFDHSGFAVEEIEIALREALDEGRRPRGASTISQQLAKNLWLSPRRSVVRKLREALLTRGLERHLDKRRILELYLNVVEFGRGVYGAEAAARHYFGRPAAELDTRQAAELAAGLPRPDVWHPGSDSPAYRRRVQIALRRMEATDWLRGLL